MLFEGIEIVGGRGGVTTNNNITRMSFALSKHKINMTVGIGWARRKKLSVYGGT